VLLASVAWSEITARSARIFQAKKQPVDKVIIRRVRALTSCDCSNRRVVYGLNVQTVRALLDMHEKSVLRITAEAFFFWGYQNSYSRKVNVFQVVFVGLYLLCKRA